MSISRFFILWLFLMFASLSYAVDVYSFSSADMEKKALAVAKNIRCPKCKNQNILDSDSLVAKDLRHKVYDLIESGKSEAYVYNYMRDRYGDFVVYKPLFQGSYLLFAIPLAFFVFFVVGVSFYFRK